MIHVLPRNPKYNLTDFSASEVLNNHISLLTSFRIHANNDELDLAYVYWFWKMHKVPSTLIHCGFTQVFRCIMYACTIALSKELLVFCCENSTITMFIKY